MDFSARRFFMSWFMFWVAVAAVSVWFLHPIRKHIKLGIDLVGGTYITLDVKVDKAVEHELREKQKSLVELLKEKDKKAPTSQKVDGNSILLTFDNGMDASDSSLAIRDDLAGYSSSVSGSVVAVEMKSEKVNSIKRWALESNIEVLNTRLSKIGVEEITVVSKGEKSIIVELPDVDDPAQAKALIGTPAMLEFKLVEKSGSSKEEILEEYGGDLPDGMVIIPDKDSTKSKPHYHLVSEYAEVGGRDLRDSYADIRDVSRGVAVAFKLSPVGGKKFHEMTRKNIGKPLAAILDGRAISVATIQSAIQTEGQITGSFSQDQAKELAMLLKSGAFVAPVEFAEERRIGPSLGAESIKKGVMSCLIGLGLVLVFGMFYYKVSGIFAFLALMFNLILTLLGLSLFGATLTLPGIAGMVLTVGMAIDASILIYEKIKELLKGGAGIRTAVKDGFSDAMVVILDANITTFIVGIVLFKFGSGPIKGFAVTMMLGIISTLITGLFFLRSIFSFMLENTRVKKLSI
jgi:preprotein translocase subunit SecD